MSTAQARREARMRKILENSESRLQRILNNDNTADQNCCSYLKEMPSDSVKDATDPPTAVPSYNKPEFPKKRASYQVNKSQDSSHTNDFRTIYQNPAPDNAESATEVEFRNFSEQKPSLRNWIIVLLAVFVRYMLLVNEQYLPLVRIDFLVKYHANKIFMPFVMFEITEFAFFRPFTPQSGLLNVLFMLNLRISVELVQSILTVTRIGWRMMQDFMIYFFAFILFDQMIIFALGEGD